MSGIFQDGNGLNLMLGDSHAASQQFGFDGSGLRNVPKSKFMFYVKFHRARSQGGSAWERGVGFAVKSIDRPRVGFKLETLNQYNRKRIVHTDSEFEALAFKFHDTVLEEVQRMFEEYYAFYFNDPLAYSENVTNDIVSQRMDPVSPFGLKAIPYSDGFFSHITVYQIFNRAVSTFECVNPKIQNYNPDEFDYAQHNGISEIVMQVEFEGIRYLGIKPLTAELATEFGLDSTQFYDITDVSTTPTADFTNTSAGTGLIPSVDNFDQLSGSLSLSPQVGTSNGVFRDFTSDSLNSFNKSTGVATAQLGLGAFGDLLSGGISGQVSPILGLDIFGGPNGIF